MRGRDLITGLPREIFLTDQDIREAISQSIDTLVESVREVLETTPPEILSDIMRSGMVLVGGGALLKGLDVLLSQWLKVPGYRGRRSAYRGCARHRCYFGESRSTPRRLPRT